MILASSLLCSSRSSGVSSVSDQEEYETALIGNLTLTIMGDNDHNLSPVYIDCGLDRGSQFAVRGRKEMMGRLDDGELGIWISEGLILDDPSPELKLTFDSKTAPQV
jgi:hypothetical protein